MVERPAHNGSNAGSSPVQTILIYMLYLRYSLKGKTVVSKIIVVGSSPTTFVAKLL